MTVRMMQAFGVDVDQSTRTLSNRAAALPRSALTRSNPTLRPPVTSSPRRRSRGARSRLKACAAIRLQGDVGFVDVLAKMGCDVAWGESAITVRGGALRGIDVDMNAISDTAQTLAAIARLPPERPASATWPTSATRKPTASMPWPPNCVRLGITVDEHEDGLTIHPGPIRPADRRDVRRPSHGDELLAHRPQVPGIRIANPDCTAKTYPRFFNDLQALCDGSR